ncbi:hypothetical protein EON67_00155 [archaeon]|nr:MAG: hypothetical protein EON67_00155 [archaeon]
MSASEGALSGLTDEEAEALAVAGEMTTDGGEGGEKRKMTLTEVQELLERRRAEKAAKAKEDERLAEIKVRARGGCVHIRCAGVMSHTRSCGAGGACGACGAPVHPCTRAPARSLVRARVRAAT